MGVRERQASTCDICLLLSHEYVPALKVKDKENANPTAYTTVSIAYRTAGPSTAMPRLDLWHAEGENLFALMLLQGSLSEQLWFHAEYLQA